MSHIDERLQQFIDDNNIIISIKRTGYTNAEMDKPVYATSNNKFEVWIQHATIKRKFAIYTGPGWTTITPTFALRDILDHINEISGAPDFDYWFKQMSGDEMYGTFLEDKEDAKSKRDTMNYCKRYFRHCKNIEDKMVELLGEELLQQFYELDQGDA